jgi:enoyl-CoA hydratase
MANFENIIYEKKGPKAYITLNRPEKLNAMNGEMQAEFVAATTDANDDEDIKVIIIKGAGRGFCAGWDISSSSMRRKIDFPKMREGREREAWDLLINRQTKAREIFQESLWESLKPSICQIHGYCLAAGCHLMSMADLAIASEDAVFGYTAARIGGVGPLYAPPWYLGLRKAKELCYTGWNIDAQEAYEFGWLNTVVPSDQLEAEVERYADTISKLPPLVVTFSKLSINNLYEQMGMVSNVRLRDALSAISEASTLPFSWKWSEEKIKEVGLKGYMEERDGPYREVDGVRKERFGKKK